MFAIFKILQHSLTFDMSNLELTKKCYSLDEFKSVIYYINKYKLMNDGWCFIMRKYDNESAAEFLLIDMESDRIKRNDILPILRDLKLSEILD
jgi:hypothetical protein